MRGARGEGAALGGDAVARHRDQSGTGSDHVDARRVAHHAAGAWANGTHADLTLISSGVDSPRYHARTAAVPCRKGSPTPES